MKSEILLLDIGLQGRLGVLACGLLVGGDGIALVDPGPSSSLPGLRAALARAGFGLADVRAILVTHIHLDHSGACGTIVRERSDAQVYVHTRGAPHLVDPGRLLVSARRIWGDDMETLWGEVAPVPATNVHALVGGERLIVAGRGVAAAYTPGHAVHHVSYLDIESRTAFTGDVGGMLIGRARHVVPPTPPPDIDVEQWETSVSAIRAWQPRRLMLTHFGFVEDPAAHFDILVARLQRLGSLVRQSLVAGQTDAERLGWFRRALAVDLRTMLSEQDAQDVERHVMFDESWRGLARYWRRRDSERL